MSRIRQTSLLATALIAALAGSAHGQSAQPTPPTPPRTDSGRQRVIVRDGPSRRASKVSSRRGRLDDPDDATISSAYRDARARAVIDRARSARFRQDSTLTSYDATVKQRLSAGLNVKAIGAERLLFRSELAARVRWTQSNRVHVDMLGARTAIPASFPGARVMSGAAELVPVPYFTGSERLMWWFNLGGDGDDDDFDDTPFSYVNPLERGAEGVYEYRSGDSAVIRLPGDREITLREVNVRPRQASDDLIVGSLWFESTGGQLVRAAFKPSAPMDMMKIIGEDSFDDVPAPMRAMMTPFVFDVESFTIDYGLYGDRWWLPRSQTAIGEMRIGFARSKGTIDQSFRYASVNGTDSLPTPSSTRRRFGADVGDDVGQAVQGVVDGVIPGRQFNRRERRYTCAKGDTAVTRERRGAVRMTISMPCDTAALTHSNELPPSIFDSGEAEFKLADARALAKDLGLDAQIAAITAGSSTGKTTVEYGWRDGLMRYNRVEGFSAGVLTQRALGRGYTGSALVRLGSADLEPNVELRALRGDAVRSMSYAGYHRLESANDWGDPFGLGGSLSALLFGRDEGFYYRSSGAEVVGLRAWTPAKTLSWRLFGERQHNAPAETNASLPNAFRDASFEPNVEAIAGTEGGGAARLRLSHGLDPRGLRLSADLRGEAAAGTFDYTRGAVDVGASRYLLGNVALALTGGAGTSGGTLSPQRAWHIGGTHTVRGFQPGVLSGDSYWLARAELGLGGSVLRPLVFYDAGWAGARDAWSASKGNVRGAGAGVSFMDGLARIDLARGVDPRTVWRAHLYVEARF
ncbi:MAG TPA: ShlB/FhaC/HecB family hemolysin secretion/activation protein [Gemmatimonadaceae bacterium]|nr:ShlB/FhaC/HecB family hemolysin secretion/activation protein [Gemmatimonadaceae bacterium]